MLKPCFVIQRRQLTAAMFLPTPEECQDLIRFVNRSNTVSTPDEFVSLLKNELRILLPYQRAICGFGYITSSLTVQAHKLISVDFPVEYLKEIATPDGGFTSPQMADWMKTRQPQVFEEEDEATQSLPADWLQKLRRFGLRSLLAHGVHDLHGQCTSYFALANLQDKISDHHRSLIMILVPLLHTALQRVVNDVPYLGVEPELNREHFTAREIELLTVLAAGKKQQAIAAQLGISENTVRNALKRIYDKLGVTRSIQAVDRAKSLRLLK